MNKEGNNLTREWEWFTGIGTVYNWAMRSTNSFPFEMTIEVIFRDVDAMGHVNNAVYFTYLETARTRFFFDGLGISAPGELPVILAEASCSYRSAARFGEKLTVGLGVARIGNKSFELGYRIGAEDGRVVAEAKTVMVAYDYEKESSMAIPENLRRLLQSYLLEGRVRG